MQLKKFTRKDRHGNMMSFEFDVPQANVPAMQSIPMYDHPGEPKGTDTVPAWLTPGEFVVNKEATDMFGPMIKKINDIGRQKQKATYAQTGTKILSRSLLDEDEDFQTQLNKMLDKYEGSEFTKDKLYNIIDGESSFDPTVKNPNSSATGLFQFTDTAINDLIDQGKIDKDFTTDKIKDMSAVDQLKLYETYLDRWKYGGDAHLGVMQAAPGAYFEKFRSGDNKGNLNQEVFPEGSKSYRDNPVWVGDDGKMTFASISNYYDNRAKKDLPGMGMVAQQVAPDTGTSGAQVVSGVSDVPPMNVSMPPRDMSSMEPIEGPTSGNIAQYLDRVRGKNVVPRPTSFQNVIEPAVGLPDELSQQGMEINPYPVRDGKVLSPEYLAALQDQDFGGMGSDSAMFKTDQQATMPQLARFYPDSILRPGDKRQDAQMYPDAIMRPGDQRKDAIPKPLTQSDITKASMLDINKGIPDAPPYIPVNAMIEAKKEKDAFEAKRRAEAKRMELINRGPDDPRMLQDYMRGYAMQGKDLSGVSTENQLNQDPKGPDMGFDIKGFEPDPKQSMSQQVQNLKEKEETNTLNDIVTDTAGESQPESTNEKQKAEELGNKSNKKEKQKAESFFKNLLGGLFDKRELARAAIMYLGSRAMGYNHGGSLNFALKGYIGRIDALEAGRLKLAQSKEGRDRFTIGSLQNYVRSGDLNDLVEKVTATPTGEFVDFYGTNKFGKPFKIKVQKFDQTVGGVKTPIYVDAKGKTHNPYNYSTDPMYVRGTDEYKSAVIQYSDLIAKQIRSIKDQIGIVGKDKNKNNIYLDDINASEDAQYLIMSGLDNQIPLDKMLAAIGKAYRNMAADRKSSPKGPKPTSLLGYVNDIFMDEYKLPEKGLFRVEPTKKQKELGQPGDFVSTPLMEKLRRNVAAVIKRSPGTRELAVGNSDQMLFQYFVEGKYKQWTDLGDEGRKKYNDRAGSNKTETTTGFYLFVQEEVEKQMNKQLGLN